MSEHSDEGQAPGAPESGAAGGLPRPTVRESLRRGLFVRLPTEGESGEGLPGPEQPAEAYGDPAQAAEYGEVVAEEYEGWRQLPDGSWEQVDAAPVSYAEGYDPTPAQAYPEIDAGANFASVAGGEPFYHEEASAESAWSYAVPEAPGAPQAEVVQYEEVVVEQSVEVEAAPEPVAEVQAPEAAPVEAEIAPEPVAEVQAPAEPVPEVEPVAAETEPEDQLAAAGIYIPGGVELLEGDMPVYGEKENVPPMFENSGLGEPLFIEFGDLARMLTGLRRLLPTGTRLTYNYDYERAWVRTSAEVDLPSFAERVQTLVSEDEKASE